MIVFYECIVKYIDEQVANKEKREEILKSSRKIQEFTTAKKMTKLETNEEKEIRKAYKKRKEQEGEKILQRLDNYRTKEKELRRADKKIKWRQVKRTKYGKLTRKEKSRKERK